jgi:hypothetical protein
MKLQKFRNYDSMILSTLLNTEKYGTILKIQIPIQQIQQYPQQNQEQIQYNRKHIVQLL